jgi:hypothetical protein
MTWRLPDTYHSAGHGRGTATLKFYEGRDILEIGAWYERHASAGKLASRRVRRHALGAPVLQRLNERVLDRLFRHADVANRAASAPRIRVASSR